MTRNWKIIEKVIGIFQIVWGTLVLVIIISSFKQFFDISFERFDNYWEYISIPKVVKNYHYLILLPLMTIFAGLTLILKKKIGWLMGIVTSATYGISIVLLPWTIDKEIGNITLIYVFTGLISLVFITIFGLLMTKQIREKYNPTKKNWVIMSILFALLILDRLFI